MIRRAPLLGWIVLLAFALAGCVNDYDQFDYTLGQPRETEDAGPGPGPMEDASVRDGGGRTDEGDQGIDAAEEPRIDGFGSDRHIESDGAADVPDVAKEVDAHDAGGEMADGGSLEAMSRDVRTTDDGGADASVEDGPAAGDDASTGEDGSDDVDASVGADGADGGSATDDAPMDGSCPACVLPHAVAKCASNGTCAIAICAAGFDDCDLLPENGCETSIASDVDHCGGCHRACSDLHALSRECAAGVCVSSCVLGFANCERPLVGADDGCELPVSSDDARCGSCGNDCRAQGGALVCGNVPNLCGCVDNLSCRNGSSTGSCQDGRCKCGPDVCRGGETCQAAGGADVCSCNGGPACETAETCCQTPAGCRDLEADPSNCGACGRSCPYGFFCDAGTCSCNADSQCDAGSSGTCAAGQCVCNGTSCSGGQRCLADGRCG